MLLLPTYMSSQLDIERMIGEEVSDLPPAGDRPISLELGIAQLSSSREGQSSVGGPVTAVTLLRAF